MYCIVTEAFISKDSAKLSPFPILKFLKSSKAVILSLNREGIIILQSITPKSDLINPCTIDESFLIDVILPSINTLSKCLKRLESKDKK